MFYHKLRIIIVFFLRNHFFTQKYREQMKLFFKFVQ